MAADPTRLQALSGTPAAAILAVLDVLDGAPGGAAGWLLEHGTDQAKLGTWQKRLRGEG